ncbi:MAG TPA: universal stress protein [Noviherbaspirillum sp.]|jgi:nucleotide-binding universal stress UspA family protein|uniref:universal stress protein n=1 Tax=Noviherbaspirillum sp. TaxID=1926288 RepID=UPI002DDCC5A9|nr:universal stress protein [Noviherbaspirillum sp.]HEV2608693.1 universal stress protein [Noviherbaspirillum sp.]
MNVLLLVDGSACSNKAVEYVASNPNLLQNSDGLHLLHVHFPAPRGLARSIVGEDAVNNHYEQESATALKPAEEILRKNGIHYVSTFTVGDIPEQVDAYVKKHGIGMIVMGSHGHGGFKSFVTGSVTTKVLTMASVPVLVVR